MAYLNSDIPWTQEGVILSEISQRKAHTVWFHLHAEYKDKKKPTSEQFNQTETDLIDTENKQVVAREEECGDWVK